MAINLESKYMRVASERTEDKIVDDSIIKTDRFNSECKSVKLGNFTFILPGNSLIRTDGKITINRVEDNYITINKTLDTILYDSVRKCGNFDSIMVSGGIDSSIIAAIGLKINKGCNLIVGGFKDSEDVRYAEILGTDLNSKVTKVILDDNEVEKIAKTLSELGLDTYSIIIGITEYAVMRYAKEKGCKNILSGLGSDELFFGFKKHRDVPPDKLKSFREERLKYLGVFDLLRLKKMSDKIGIEVKFPYLDEEVVEYALSLEIDTKSNDIYDKKILRDLGNSLGLNDLLLERKKKAMQYGSGVTKSLERLSKKHRIKNVGEFIESI